MKSTQLKCFSLEVDTSVKMLLWIPSNCSISRRWLKYASVASPLSVSRLRPEVRNENPRVSMATPVCWMVSPMYQLRKLDLPALWLPMIMHVTCKSPRGVSARAVGRLAVVLDRPLLVHPAGYDPYGWRGVNGADACAARWTGQWGLGTSLGTYALARAVAGRVDERVVADGLQPHRRALCRPPSTRQRAAERRERSQGFSSSVDGERQRGVCGLGHANVASGCIAVGWRRRYPLRSSRSRTAP